MAKPLAISRLDRIRSKRVRPTHKKDMQILRFQGVPDPIALQGAPLVHRVLDQIITGWPYQTVTEPCPFENHAAYLAHVFETPQGLRAASHYLDEPLDGLSPTSAACAVVADLAQAFVDADPNLRALHCGAVKINGRLVVLTGPHRAGKSTLIARLTAEPGFKVFCDDVLPITATGQGVSLGIAPRLRLPLPDSAQPAFTAHVDRWITAQDSRYAYLTPPSLAVHGETAPLGAIIVLDRRDSGPAQFTALAPDTVLRTVLARSLADSPSAQTAFEQMHDLISGRLSLRLVYSDLEQAVDLLRRAFSGSDAFDPTVTVAPVEEASDTTEPDQMAPPVAPDDALQRSTQVAVRRVGQSHFLWMVDDPMLWELNLLGSAIWALLDIPGSARDIAEALTEIFPDEPPERVMRDVRLLLGQLQANGLIETAA